VYPNYVYPNFSTIWTSNYLQRVSHPSTWDILQHYVDLSKVQIEDLENVIDSPSNGMLLDIGMHVGFDKLDWYFEQTVCLLLVRVLWK